LGTASLAKPIEISFFGPGLRFSRMRRKAPLIFLTDDCRISAALRSMGLAFSGMTMAQAGLPLLTRRKRCDFACGAKHPTALVALTSLSR
jgi:hypothetical protein